MRVFIAFGLPLNTPGMFLKDPFSGECAHVDEGGGGRETLLPQF